MQALIGKSAEKSVASRFVQKLAEFLVETKRQQSRLTFVAARAKTVKLDDPRLVLDDHSMCFEYEVVAPTSSHGKSPITVMIKINCSGMVGNSSKTSARAKQTGKLTFQKRCDCSEYSNFVTCEHALAAVIDLESHFANRPAESAVEWLNSIVSDGQELGVQLLQELQATATQKEVREQYRLQWRVAAPLPHDSRGADLIDCYLQKARARGDGWTAGRKITSPIINAPSSAFAHPDDYLIACLLDTHQCSAAGDCRALIRALNLLKDRPDFCWDIEGQPPVTLRQCEAIVEFKDENGLFVPELKIDGEPFPEFQGSPTKSSVQFVIRDIHKFTIRYFELSPDQLNCMRMIKRAVTRGARLNAQDTLTMTKVLSEREADLGLIALVPELLSGPEIALPPKIELHLMPRSEGRLEARLRIACEGLETPPTPGMGSSRIPVFTPTGACQYVRDLAAEIENANGFSDQLQMGHYQFDGPYTWLTENLEQSMRLLAQCRTIGEAGLPVCWPTSKPMRLLGEITPQCLKVRLTSERDWFGIEGELCIEGLQVPLVELFAALRSGARFVPLGEGGFATISDDLRQRLSIMDDVSYPERSRLSISRAAAGMVKDAIGADMVAEMDDRWHEAIERMSDKTKVPKNPPKALQADLRDYQLAGYQWLSQLSHWGLGGCLADDMGLGKTVQALGILLDRSKLGPALIIAPTSVGVNWLRETEKFAPKLKPLLYREHDRDQLIQNAAPGELVIASYQMVQRDGERFCSRSWSTLILDEAQYIKNFNTKTCGTVRQIQSDWSLALTGTPLENHLGELWSLMRVISPGLLGSWDRFRERFADPIERSKDHERLLALGRVLRPFMLRRTKQEVLKELPPRTEIIQTVELSDEERKRYDAARLAALADLSAKDKGENEQQRRILVLSWLTRLRQLACHPKLVDPRWAKSSSKLDMLLELIKELVESKHRALVFSQFVQHLNLVRQALDKIKIKYQYLDGSTPPSKRQAAVDAFQQGEGDLFLISLKAGGTGLNLTGADYVLHLDPWWNPAVEDQATDRAHRIGQTQPVTVFRLVAKDTIEEQILSLHASKRELIAGVLEGADRAAKLSTQELVDLIRLGLAS